MFITIALSSCSSDKETNNTDDTTISSSAASGKVYNTAFTFKGGYARTINESGVNKFTIYLSSQNLNCNDSGLDAFPIRISTPVTVGLNTSNVYIVFNSLTNDDYVSVTSGVQVQIESIGATLKGRVKGSSLDAAENNINGTFEVPICD